MSFASLLLVIAGAGPLRAPDSVAVLKSAKRAQEDFEFTRRHNLAERAGGWSDVCGPRIGRVCYWNESGDDEDEPPAEPARIRRARTRLLDALDAAAAAVPGDEWIVGQRVRYRLEDGQPLLAARVAAECRAVAWWCEARDGLVRHMTGDFVGSDSVFAAALADMPDDERCGWSDISSLLEGDLAARYRRLDCAGRAAFGARWWWLAQPLYSLGGNDRRTEQFARRVMVRIQQGRRTPLDLAWDDDLREGMRRRSRTSSTGEPCSGGVIRASSSPPITCRPTRCLPSTPSPPPSRSAQTSERSPRLGTRQWAPDLEP